MIIADDKLLYGITGTAVGAVGAGLSVNEIQAIVSIIVTVAGFIISVLVPTIIRIVKKVKEAKEDGVITKEEAKEIIDEIADGGKTIVKEGKHVVESVKKAEESDKSEGE